MKYIRLDFETRSACDLEDCGAWVYSEHPTTRALMVSIAVDGGEPVWYDLFYTDEIPPPILEAIETNAIIGAWNVAFEYGIWHNVMKHWPKPRIGQWFDSAAIALAAGFPAKLELCAQALMLTEQKDKEGHRLITWFSKPISAGHKKGQFRELKDYPNEYAAFVKYNIQDVVVEAAIENALPYNMSADELAFWHASFEMNARGIKIDLDLVRALDALTATGTTIIGNTVAEASGGQLTGAEVKNNHAKTLRFIQGEGVAIHSVAKARVKDALELDGLPEPARLVLEARQVLGKSSTSKLSKMENMTGQDGTAKFLIRPNGAATGRDTSMGIQLQNLPRGDKLPVDDLVRAAIAGDTQGFLDLAYVKRGDKKVFDPLAAISTCLRGCLRAERNFFQADWAGIEPRMIAWQSGDEHDLENFRAFDKGVGPDGYRLFASTYFNVAIELVTSFQRQFGKVGKLACQYGAGPATVRIQAKDSYGLDLTETESIKLVDTYRATHQKNVAYWHNLESAAKMACRRPDMVYTCGRMKFLHDGTHLWMRFPSGRKMCFPYASLKMKMTHWGEMKEQIHYMAVLHGKWVECSTYGGSICNNAVQGASACLMRYATLNLRRLGYDIRLRVHDELLADVGPEADFAAFKAAFLQVPEWAAGLPIAGEGWQGIRYHK